ncbi:PREDICTED: F-box/kelch-repeat protein At3g06240-like [Camelina sativa]|uniref:F-box/kelch-repeat protein At3g06240-like n=1 Tax=Camelina sativa TaxID=90675 RepID=A0ABM1RMK7_CAMSA|nr:PREDICTED: F-box/kelch-repeat protein At3g06240-like [Camelina sativa]
MEAAKRVDEDGGEEETKEDKASRESLVLPLDIITEIILRLPAKSIGRFRCVSKLFYSLSSDQGFVKSHLERTNHRKIIVSTYNLFSLDVDSIGDGCEGGGGGTRELVAAVELNYPLKDDMKKVSRHECRRNWVTIIGSSNGLVCIGIGIESYPRKDCVFLFNPTTGDSKG